MMRQHEHHSAACSPLISVSKPLPPSGQRLASPPAPSVDLRGRYEGALGALALTRGAGDDGHLCLPLRPLRHTSQMCQSPKHAVFPTAPFRFLTFTFLLGISLFNDTIFLKLRHLWFSYWLNRNDSLVNFSCFFVAHICKIWRILLNSGVKFCWIKN